MMHAADDVMMLMAMVVVRTLQDDDHQSHTSLNYLVRIGGSFSRPTWLALKKSCSYSDNCSFIFYDKTWGRTDNSLQTCFEPLVGVLLQEYEDPSNRTRQMETYLAWVV